MSQGWSFDYKFHLYISILVYYALIIIKLTITQKPDEIEKKFQFPELSFYKQELLVALPV